MENHLNSKNSCIPNGKVIGIYFNGGKISSPEFGTVTMEATIPLLLPRGEFKHPAITKGTIEFNQIVKNLVSEYRGLWPNELDEAIEARVKDILRLAQLFIGKPLCDSISSSQMQAWICVSFLAFAMDDIVDSLDELSELNWSYPGLESYIEVFWNLSDNKYKNRDCIPRYIQAFEPIYDYCLKLIQLSMRGTPNFVEFNKYFEFSGANAVRGWILLMETNPLQFSHRTKSIAWAYTAGSVSVLEYATLLQDINVSEDVRADILFRRLIEAFATASALMNDLLGIRRDIKFGEIRDSSILSRVKDTGVDLHVAFDDALVRLHQEIHDVRLISEIMTENYKDNKDLVKYLDAMKCGLDGQCYWYLEAARYGDVEGRILDM